MTITTFPRSTIHPSVATCSYRHGVRLYFLQTQSGSQQTSYAAERYKIWSGRRWRSGQQSAPLPCHIPPDSLLRIARKTAGSYGGLPVNHCILHLMNQRPHVPRYLQQADVLIDSVRWVGLPNETFTCPGGLSERNRPEGLVRPVDLRDLLALTAGKEYARIEYAALPVNLLRIALPPNGSRLSGQAEECHSRSLDPDDLLSRPVLRQL